MGNCKSIFSICKIFALFPVLISSARDKALNSAFGAEVLQDKGLTSRTWFLVAIVYPAHRFPPDMKLLPPLYNSKSKSERGVSCEFGGLQQTCSIVFRESWCNSSHCEIGSRAAGFKVADVERVNSSCFSRTAWYLSSLLGETQGSPLFSSREITAWGRNIVIGCLKVSFPASSIKITAAATALKQADHPLLTPSNC